MTTRRDSEPTSPVTTAGQDSTPPGDDGTRKLPSCKQCRARKVKCDRREGGCKACERLGFVCSFIDASWSAEEDLSRTDFTQAGTKRRRILKACDACHSQKAKCSGEEPCRRCQTYGHPCVYKQAHRHANRPPALSDTSTEPNSLAAPSTGGTETATEMSMLTPMSTTTSAPSSAAPHAERDLWLDRHTIRQCIDAYFDKVDPVVCVFLHKASLMTDWTKGHLSPTLLKALVSYGYRLLYPGQDGDATSAAWMQEVEATVLGRLNNMSIAQLQTLMLLIQYRYTSDKCDTVWMLISIAARIAFTKRLNHERPNGSPLEQEVSRRLMWSVFIMDKVLSGGLEDMSTCPVSRVNIRLPGNERCFTFGIAPRTGFLVSNKEVNESDMGVVAFIIRIIDLRDRILRYTKQVLGKNVSPWESANTLRSLADELHQFQDTLPEELKLNSQNLTFRAHSPHLTGFVMLHTYWRQCHCDLFRFFVPGIRESVSRQSLAATPQHYVDWCQRNCLDSAKSLIDFWSEVYRLDARKPVDECLFAVCAYQCARIVYNLRHLLPEDRGRSLEDSKEKLGETLEMLTELRNTYPIVRGCIEDIERIVLRLDRRPESSNISERASPSQYSTTHVLRSKHSFVPVSPREDIGRAMSAPRTPSSASGIPGAMDRAIVPSAQTTPAITPRPSIVSLDHRTWEDHHRTLEAAETLANGQLHRRQSNNPISSILSPAMPPPMQSPALSAVPPPPPSTTFDKISPTGIPTGIDNDMQFPLDPFDLRYNAYSGSDYDFMDFENE